MVVNSLNRRSLQTGLAICSIPLKFFVLPRPSLIVLLDSLADSSGGRPVGVLVNPRDAIRILEGL